MQTEKIIDKIVSWLKDYATKAGVKGYVIGVSGGVDSGAVSYTHLDVYKRQLSARHSGEF